MIGLRVLLAFSRATDEDLLNFGKSVSRSMRANEFFASPPVNLEELDTAINEFAEAVSARPSGGVLATARRDARRSAVVGLLRDLASYVQIAARNNLTVMLSSGFSPVVQRTAQTELEQPQVLSIAPGISTQLVLRVKTVSTAKSYETRISTGGGEWKPGGIFTKASRMLFNNLTPGMTYSIQVRAIGGSTGHSDWSDAISHMSL